MYRIIEVPQTASGVPPLCPSRFHRTSIHTILDERYNPVVRAYMLEIAAIIIIVLTIPIWLPMVVGIVTSLISFGFMAVFWLIFIVAVLFLIFA